VSKLVQVLNSSLALTEKRDKLSRTNDTRERIVRAEPGSIHVHNSTVSTQPDLPSSRSSVFADDRSSGVWQDPVFVLPSRRPQRSPMSSPLVPSPSCPPPLPMRRQPNAGTRSRSTFAGQNTPKRHRPPPPLPDESAELAVSGRAESLSHAAATISRTGSRTGRKPAPTLRCVCLFYSMTK